MLNYNFISHLLFLVWLYLASWEEWSWICKDMKNLGSWILHTTQCGCFWASRPPEKHQPAMNVCNWQGYAIYRHDQGVGLTKSRVAKLLAVRWRIVFFGITLERLVTNHIYCWYVFTDLVPHSLSTRCILALHSQWRCCVVWQFCWHDTALCWWYDGLYTKGSGSPYSFS